MPRRLKHNKSYKTGRSSKCRSLTNNKSTELTLSSTTRYHTILASRTNRKIELTSDMTRVV